MDKKITALTPAMRRSIQQGVVSIHTLMAQALQDMGMDLRSASSVTLSVPHPSHNKGVVVLTGVAAGGGHVGELTLPITMIGLRHGESWGLDPGPEEDTGSDEETERPEGATVV
jgi:hypothetical protein